MRFTDDPRVRHQQTRHVGPVLVDLRTDATRDDGARDVAATARKSLDRTIGKGTIEAGNHAALLVCESSRDGRLGLFREEATVRVEANHLGGIDQRAIEQMRDDQSREIFASACGVARAGTVANAIMDEAERGIEIEFETQIGHDRAVSLGNPIEE